MGYVHPQHITYTSHIDYTLPNLDTTSFNSLSLHDALPILPEARSFEEAAELLVARGYRACEIGFVSGLDRKSTRLNSSHTVISYAVFCLKKKKSYYR